jgi:hypothetical protein
MISCIRQKVIFPKLTGHDTGRSYNRRSEHLSKEIADTVSAIAEIAGESITTTFNTISLLKLSDKIQMAIRDEGSEW